MSRRPPALPVEVLEAEAWEAPETLNDADRRAQTGFDGPCAGGIHEEEDDL
jgi:hypothetical protein